MKITYPNMGNLGLAVKSILTDIGCDVVVPPRISDKTAALGVKFSPEGACYPFKLVLGNVIEGLRQGADTIVMLGGSGPCRFGYFGHLMDEIIVDLGFRPKLIILEGDGVVEQINSLRAAAGVGWYQLVEALYLGWCKMEAADLFETWAYRYRPVEKIPGQVDKIILEGLGELDDLRDRRAVGRLTQKIQHKMDQCLDLTKKPRLKIGLVGDIYMLIEPYANHGLERFLGEMGMEICRSIHISEWIKSNLGAWVSYLHRRKLIGDAAPYLQDFVGGHGLDTVANIVRYQRSGYHGIIHVLPMTCMPEIVAQSITPKVVRELDIPVLTVVLDEQSGTAGLHSRLEAFSDVLIRKNYSKDLKRI